MNFSRFEPFPEIIINNNLTFDHQSGLNFISLDSGKSIFQFARKFSKRASDHKEYWILDVPHWKTLDDKLVALEDVKPRLDDKFFIIDPNVEQEDLLYVHELYYFGHNQYKKCLKYGNWSFTEGLKVTSIPRWERRKDLDVGL